MLYNCVIFAQMVIDFLLNVFHNLITMHSFGSFKTLKNDE